MKRRNLQLTVLLVALISAHVTWAKDFIIYSIAHQLPMQNKQEIKVKDYYVNLGKAQGLQEGTVLDVYRIQSELNPFESNKRYNHKIKIGELKVIHADGEASIGRVLKMDTDEDKPLFEFDQMMVGDHVSVKVK